MPCWEGFWCALYCCCVLFCFWHRVSLCSPGWPRTFNLPASAFQTGWPPGLPWGALDRKIKETLGNLGKGSFSQNEWLWIRTPSTNLILLDCYTRTLGSGRKEHGRGTGHTMSTSNAFLILLTQLHVVTRQKRADAIRTGVDQIQLENVQNQVLGWGGHHVVRSVGATYRLLPCHYFLNNDFYNPEVI